MFTFLIKFYNDISSFLNALDAPLVPKYRIASEMSHEMSSTINPRNLSWKAIASGGISKKQDRNRIISMKVYIVMISGALPDDSSKFGLFVPCQIPIPVAAKNIVTAPIDVKRMLIGVSPEMRGMGIATKRTIKGSIRRTASTFP